MVLDGEDEDGSTLFAVTTAIEGSVDVCTICGGEHDGDEMDRYMYGHLIFGV